MAVNILLADDDELLRNLVKEVLEEEGYEVFAAEDGDEAIDIFWNNQNLSLAILDIMMPGTDGMGVLKEIREKSDMPVLMLTALGDSASELSALRNGANDYVSKPFHYDILTERIKNLLKLSKAEDLDTMEFGMLKIDPPAHKVYVNGTEVVLNNKEYLLMELLVNNKNIVLTRETILDRIWGFDYEGDIRTIDTHIKMLRAKIGDAGNYIKTVRGTGYCFEVNE
ncbi:MAG: response regulator transcription factor [Lachnospiraceae bacterium]|jgi:DNA-binding response OmpR family regulator|nr:response regulator transcription factor [Lachnospiraceae bacterium]